MNTYIKNQRQGRSLFGGGFLLGLGGLFVLLAVAIGYAALVNQQTLLGNETKIVEKKIEQLRLENEKLMATVISASSRPELLRKQQIGIIKLDTEIKNDAIVLIQPVTRVATSDAAEKLPKHSSRQ